MGSGLRVSRRGVLVLVGRLGVGVGGAVAMGGVVASGGTPIAAAADRVTEPEETAVVTERRPHSAIVEVRYATDHTTGARGAALWWGLEEFSKMRPDIRVNIRAHRFGTFTQRLLEIFYPGSLPHLFTNYRVDSGPTQRAFPRRDPEPLPHLVLLSHDEFLRFGNLDIFLRINDFLARLDHYLPEDLYFMPDSFTENGFDHSFPQPTVPSGRQFGLPFELSINGFLANASLAESAGVRLPDSENSWTWDDWTEWDARITDPEIGIFGTWARDDYAGQYMPQMYTNGLKKPLDDGLTGTTFDRTEAMEAWSYLIDKVFARKTSPTANEARVLAGEDENPFAAGKIGIWPTDRVSSIGMEAARINGRFAWTLLPAVIASDGGAPGHSWSMRANLLTASAWHDGNAEQAVEWAVFLTGERFQGRVGIERGHFSVNRRALEETEAEVPPPEGLKWLKVYADRPDNRNPYPFEGSTFWWRYHKELAGRAWSGQTPAAEALAACQGWGKRYFRFYYDGPKPFVREPVYP